MVVDSMARMSKFELSVFNDVVKECINAMLVKEVDIARLITHS